eukprot:455961_1
MRDYFDYMSSILESFKNKYVWSFPVQLDLYILPQNIVDLNKEEQKDDEQDEKTENQQHSQIDVEEILNGNDLCYIKKEGKQSFSFNALFEWMMHELLNKLHSFDVNAPKERRICFVIDRRTENGTFYLFKPLSEAYKFAKYDLSELYFDRSSRSIIPILNNDPQSFGILFISFHFQEAQKIQIYQYWNQNKTERIGGRFGFEGIWKQYFMKQNEADLGAELQKIDDDEFEQWFHDKTKEFRECGYNLGQLRSQRNANYYFFHN